MARKQPLTNQEFKDIYSKVPRLTVEIVLFTDQGVLLTKRKQDGWIDQWHLPGGTVLYKEPLRQAIERIGKEELSIFVEATELLGYIEYASEEQERGFGWSVGIAFLCQTKQDIPSQSNQGEDVQLFKKLPTKMVQEQKLLLQQLLS